ncbi:hypothetical protein [Celerinatantimonas sp. MCCC 1A17872]|uniref:hypothetical protein n=1 Tax=Celerinatantimonas sp. MCCC 1A17872 TaxID=3177514 RepID=UPI0038BE7E1F
MLKYISGSNKNSKQESILKMDKAYEYYLNNKEEIDKETDRLFLYYQPLFSKTYLICDGAIGAAQYLALLAYPLSKEDSERIKFFSSMVSAYCRAFDEELLSQLYSQPKEIQNAWLIKKPWKLIEQTLSKGTKRLQKRLQAYHAYTAYNQSVLDSAGKSFEEILSWCSQAYESRRSKLQDEKSRLENLKRTIHRSSRPVYHLIRGYYVEHLVHYAIYERHPTQALVDSSWLERAIVTSRRMLAAELVGYDYYKKDLHKPLKLKFDPKEIIHLELASHPFIKLRC